MTVERWTDEMLDKLVESIHELRESIKELREESKQNAEYINKILCDKSKEQGMGFSAYQQASHG